ncbi:MAG: hypothetical protein PHS54_04910 [Clostridia bacterium]|nr:hypothetical protein [Clostridia bacterium]
MFNDEYEQTILDKLNNKNTIEKFFKFVNEGLGNKTDLEYIEHWVMSESLIICNANSGYGKVQFKFFPYKAHVTSTIENEYHLNHTIEEKFTIFMIINFGKQWFKNYKNNLIYEINKKYGKKMD